jgi:hypothetical protein
LSNRHDRLLNISVLTCRDKILSGVDNRKRSISNTRLFPIFSGCQFGGNYIFLRKKSDAKDLGSAI